MPRVVPAAVRMGKARLPISPPVALSETVEPLNVPEPLSLIAPPAVTETLLLAAVPTLALMATFEPALVPVIWMVLPVMALAIVTAVPDFAPPEMVTEGDTPVPVTAPFIVAEPDAAIVILLPLTVAPVVIFVPSRLTVLAVTVPLAPRVRV